MRGLMKLWTNRADDHGFAGVIVPTRSRFGIFVSEFSFERRLRRHRGRFACPLVKIRRRRRQDLRVGNARNSRGEFGRALVRYATSPRERVV